MSLPLSNLEFGTLSERHDLREYRFTIDENF
jgi:hypothetical protein